MVTRQKIISLLKANDLANKYNFGRTQGYAIGCDGSASYSISSNNTHANSIEQSNFILKVSKILTQAKIDYRVELGTGRHKEIVFNVSNPSRG